MPVESLCDREYLIYDFGVKESETITHFDWITQKSVSSTISKIDTVGDRQYTSAAILDGR